MLQQFEIESEQATEISQVTMSIELNDTDHEPISCLWRPQYYRRQKIAGKEKLIEASIDLYGQIGSILINTYPGREGIIINGVSIWEEFKRRSKTDFDFMEIRCTKLYLPLDKEQKLHLLYNEYCSSNDEEQLRMCLGKIYAILGRESIAPDEVEDDEAELARKQNEKLKAKLKSENRAKRQLLPIRFNYSKDRHDEIYPKIQMLIVEMEVKKKEDVLEILINHYYETKKN